MFINTDTKEVLRDETALRLALRHISLPLNITEDTLTSVGFARVHEGIAPEPTNYQIVESDGLEERDGKWYQVWKVTTRKFKETYDSHPRIIEIKNELKVLDDRSVRPLRTLVMRKGGEPDYNVLLGIEKERDVLMEEMGNLIESIKMVTIE